MNIRKLNRVISLMLAVFLLASFFNVDAVSFADLDTDVSKLLVGKSDRESINIVKSHYSGSYETQNNKEISFNILREYKLIVYVDAAKNTGKYRGYDDLKNKQYRYLGFTKDGHTPVTNPYFDNDATSSNDLRLKNWQNFNESLSGFDGVRTIQKEHIFNANLFDPIGQSAVELLVDGSNISIKEILKKKLPAGELEDLQQYSQAGSPPTLKNEGSIMLQHNTSKSSYYDSFIVGPMDLGDTYVTTIKPNQEVYTFRDEDTLEAQILVTTKIDFTSTLAEVDEIFLKGKQKIEFMGHNLVAEYIESEQAYQYLFTIQLNRKDYKVGEVNEVSLSSITHLNSVFGDYVPKLGEGTLKVAIETGELKADFSILKAAYDVTGSTFNISESVIREDDETEKETIKRLALSETLTLEPSLYFDESINEVTNYNWFVYNYESNSFDYISFKEIETFTLYNTNVDKYMDDEGLLKFKLFIQDKFGITSEKIHSTTGIVDYKDIVAPIPSDGKPPVAIIKTAGHTRAGSTISFSGSRSKDSDGYITDYSFSGSNGVIVTSVNSSGKTGYATSINMGRSSMDLTVTDNSNTTDSDSVYIDVLSPIIHREVFKGDRKINRRITLDATLDEGTRYYPSSEFETSWEITPLEGQSSSSIKWDTNNQCKLVDVLFKEPGIYNIKKIVTARCTYSAGIGNYITEEVERGIKIYPDEDPIAQFAVVKYNLRQKLDNGYAAINVYDTSYSPDGDKLYKRTWWYKYDANNNGSFDDEALQLFDSDNDLKEISLRVRDVGQYEFKLSIEEDYTADTIARFISSSDILNDDTNSMEADLKIAEVLNVAPVVKLEEKANKKVEMIVVSDYSGSDKANLESDVMLLTKEMQEKKLNLVPHMLNVNDDGNSVVIGQRKVPVFKYSRYAQLHLQYDEKCITHQDNRDVNIVTTGDDAKASYPPLEIDSVLATEKEALSLPSYPNTYAGSIDPGGFSYSYNGYHTAQYYRMGSFKIYDEANLLRGFYQYPSDYRRTVESQGSTAYYLRSFGQPESYIAQTIRRLTVDVDREFTRENQVSTELEDIISINTDVIKNISLDENAEKYLVILSNKDDTLKSLDDTFIEYAISKGFIIRYSIPQIAMEQSAKGYEFDDVRFKNESIILKSGETYFELGNVDVLGEEIAMSPTSKVSDIALFNTHDPDLLLPNQSIKVKIPNGIRTVEESPYNYNRVSTNYVYKNLNYVGDRLYGLGIDLSGVKAVHYTRIGVLCEMYTGNVKLLLIKRKDDVIDMPWILDSNNYRQVQYLPNIPSHFSNLELQVIDTGLKDVINVQNIDRGFNRITSKESGYVMTKEDYELKLITNRISVTDSVGHYFESTLYLRAYGELLKDGSSRPRRKIYKLRMGIEDFSYNHRRGTILDKNSVSIEGDIDFDKMYIKDNYIVYIKDGSVYGKGRSNNGELGNVGFIEDFRKISDITLIEDSVEYAKAIELNYNIKNKSYTSKNAVLSSILNDYNDYSTDDTIYRLLGEILEMDTFYFDYESDPLEDTRYDYTHSEIFDNSLGIDPLSGTSTDEFVKTYEKVGKYVIKPRYQDNPKDVSVFSNYWLWNQDNTKINLIVHRKPVAKLRTSYEEVASETFVTLGDGGSYDLDHSASMSNRGIVKKEMMYKLSTDATFSTAAEGTRLKITPGISINITYKVQDIEGVWSDTINETVSMATVSLNEAPTVQFTKHEPTMLYEGDDVNAFIIPTDPDGDSLNVDYYIAGPGKSFSLQKTYIGVTSDVEIRLNTISNLDEGDYRIKVVVSDGEYSAQATRTITVNGISVTGTMMPLDPMAGDKLYFDIETIGFVDRVEIVLEDDMVHGDDRIQMGYNGVDYTGNSLVVNIPTEDIELTKTVHHEYIAWCTTPQSLTLKKVRNRAPYNFIIKAYRGEHVSNEFTITRDIEGDVRQLLKLTIVK